MDLKTFNVLIIYTYFVLMHLNFDFNTVCHVRLIENALSKGFSNSMQIKIMKSNK